ncbi:MAG: aldehyde dehydrogenase family protein [Turicibacter sp.]|nr:aldehyde dehydrogenase family protein [Turicibacter sp.]
MGQIVMQKASQYLILVTLELGGKSPVIVDKSANLQQAAKRIIWEKFMNSGQICVTPDV